MAPKLGQLGDLRLISEILSVNLLSLYKYAAEPDFPEPICRISNVRLYDVSKVARHLGIPLYRA